MSRPPVGRVSVDGEPAASRQHHLQDGELQPSELAALPVAVCVCRPVLGRWLYIYIYIYTSNQHEHQYNTYTDTEREQTQQIPPTISDWLRPTWMPCSHLYMSALACLGGRSPGKHPLLQSTVIPALNISLHQ